MLKKQIAVSVLGVLLLFFWYISFKLSCISISIPLIIAILLFKTNYELSVAKKICLANCYFKKNSFLYKFLTKKIIIILFSIINSIILTSILVLNITTFNIIDFIVLLFDIFFLIYLYRYLIENDSLNEDIKNPIIINTVSFINSTLIAIIFLMTNLFQTPPEYINNDLITTIHQASNQLYSNCFFIDNITRLTNEIAAIKWWLMLDVSINMSSMHYLKETIWILYLLGNYLMIFAFSRYILEIVNLTRRIFISGAK